MNISFDERVGKIVVEDGDDGLSLNWDDCVKIAQIAYDGLCFNCGDDVNEGATLCCECLEREREWHRQHCETLGTHLRGV